MSETTTPLPSQWDSAVIRQLAFAALALVATVAADFFGISQELIEEKGGRLIEAALSVLIVAVPLFLAYRARMYKATPPITEQAVKATEVREAKIEAAPSAAKEEASK